MRREIKKSTLWKCNDGCHCNIRLLWAMPNFRSNNICLLQVHKEPHSLFLVCICMQPSPFTACTEPRPLIHCCCRSCTPVVCQGILSCNHVHATSIYTNHALVFASLGIARLTDPSRYLFVYREYTLVGTYNASLSPFLSKFHSWPIPAVVLEISLISFQMACLLKKNIQQAWDTCKTTSGH